MKPKVADPYNAVILEKRQVNPLLAVFKVCPDSEDGFFPFIPGQYTTLGLRGDESRVFNAQPEPEAPRSDRIIRRTYSIGNAPHEQGYYEFYVMLVVGGQITPRLFDRRNGDRVELGKRALGIFTLDKVDPEKPLCLVATGTGLAPYVSMIRHEIERGLKRTIIVLEGVRYSWNLGYRKELEGICAEHSHIHYLPTITRVELDPDWSGPVGRLDELLGDDIVENRTGISVRPGDLEVLLCGNPGMIDRVGGWFVGKGFSWDEKGQLGDIHVEKYWVG